MQSIKSQRICKSLAWNNEIHSGLWIHLHALVCRWSCECLPNYSLFFMCYFSAIKHPWKIKCSPLDCSVTKRYDISRSDFYIHLYAFLLFYAQYLIFLCVCWFSCRLHYLCVASLLVYVTNKMIARHGIFACSKPKIKDDQEKDTHTQK